ncbi:MAG TPA: hypothetical protein VFK48_04060 [Usitatibacter sp.]|nr:hypothetical protein [Usitatibacter sp.]
MLTDRLGAAGSVLRQSPAPGQIVAIPLPKTAYRSIKVIVAESASTPALSGRGIEMSINRCPGLIDQDLTNVCNMASTSGAYNERTALTQPYSILTNAAMANKYNICWAADGGDYYINLRWNYDSCLSGTCSFIVQHQQGRL